MVNGDIKRDFVASGPFDTVSMRFEDLPNGLTGDPDFVGGMGNLLPGVAQLVGVCEHCGRMYSAKRKNKRGHRRCMDVARMHRFRRNIGWRVAKGA